MMGSEETLWRQRVRAILRRGGVRRDDIEDLCQEIAVAYFQTRGSAPWSDSAPQPHLLAHLIRSVLSDYFAQLRKCSEMLERCACYIDLAGTTDNAPLELEMIDKLRQLPSELREIITMKVLEGYTFSEIGALMSCPESTIKTRYYKGIASLRKALGVTTILAPQRIKNTETKSRRRNNDASENLGKDGVSSDGDWGGVIPLIARAAIYRHEPQPEGCGGASQVAAVTDYHAWAVNLFLPMRIIVECPPWGPSWYDNNNLWCQRMFNDDCDGWTGSSSVPDCW